MSTPSGLLVLPLGLQHLEEVSRLVNSAYRGDESRRGWTTEADILGGQRTDPQSLSEALQGSSKKRVLLGVREEVVLMGCVMLEKFEDEQGTGCYLGMLTVAPTLQARGLGQALLFEAESFARSSWQASKMTLGVIQLRESLIAWYERRGYRKTGQIKPFPYGDVKAGIPARKDLHFIMFEKTL